MAIKDLDQRFGSIAVRKGYISSEQLIDALSIQATENVEDNTHRIIGTILREKGYLSIEQINEILQDMM
ncbi:MAG: hypothetical protein GY857_16125 [Desulfobacula sp.]|nr:hypothetical protein [Desulfobacula sp.]